eukprot:1370946-Prymnesium_polylepis.1
MNGRRRPHWLVHASDAKPMAKLSTRSADLMTELTIVYVLSSIRSVSVYRLSTGTYVAYPVKLTAHCRQA